MGSWGGVRFTRGPRVSKARAATGLQSAFRAYSSLANATEHVLLVRAHPPGCELKSDSLGTLWKTFVENTRLAPRSSEEHREPREVDSNKPSYMFEFGLVQVLRESSCVSNIQIQGIEERQDCRHTSEAACALFLEPGQCGRYRSRAGCPRPRRTYLFYILKIIVVEVYAQSSLREPRGSYAV
jgi:hypothetical protein